MLILHKGHHFNTGNGIFPCLCVIIKIIINYNWQIKEYGTRADWLKIYLNPRSCFSFITISPLEFAGLGKTIHSF